MSESAVILTVPDEILLRIFQSHLLSANDICYLSVVCKRFNRVCQTQSIWEKKFYKRWPWIYNQLKMRNYDIDNWKANTFTVGNFCHVLSNHFCFISERLFNYEHVISPVLSTIIKLLPPGKCGHIYLYNELKRIIASSNHPVLIEDEERVVNINAGAQAGRQLPLRPNWQRVLPTANVATGDVTPIKLPSYENLTESYYSAKLIKFSHIEICKEEWKTFLALPSDQQYLEVGATLVEKWMNNNLDLSVDSVSLQIDALALECHDHLRSIYPSHPAVQTKLRTIKMPLQDTLWNAAQSKQIFSSINYILYEKHKFVGNSANYYAKENSFISQVLMLKKGIPITLCIIYAAICHRFGIQLQPLNFPRHFVLRWKVPGSKDEYEFIDAFGNGKKMNKLELIKAIHSILQININPDDVETDLTSPPNEVFRRMVNNLLMLFRERGKLEEVWFALELLALISPNHDKENDLLYGLFGVYARLEINFDKIIDGCSQYLKSTDSAMPIAQSILAMKQEFESLLKDQQREPDYFIPKSRNGPSNNKIKFAVGMIMKHKLYHYICVIYGWDQVCGMSEEWILRMNVDSLKNSRHQPFYHVLGNDGSSRYAAEENLIPIEPTLVPHPQIGKYFKAFNTTYYVPNEQLKKLYPEDEDIIMKFYVSHINKQ